MPAFDPVRLLASLADRWLDRFCRFAAALPDILLPEPPATLPAPRRRTPPPVPPALLEPPPEDPTSFKAWHHDRDQRRFNRLDAQELVRLAHVVRHYRRLCRHRRPISARRLINAQRDCRHCEPVDLHYLRQAPFLDVLDRRPRDRAGQRLTPVHAFIRYEPPTPWTTFNAAARQLADPHSGATDLAVLKDVLDGFHGPFRHHLPPEFPDLAAFTAAFPRTFGPAPDGALVLRHDVDDPNPQSTIPRACDDGIHTPPDLEAAAVLTGTLFRLHAGRARQAACRAPVVMLQERLRRERPDLPQWRRAQTLRTFLRALGRHPRFRLDNDTLIARLPTDYTARTHVMATIIRVLAAPDGYADPAAVARLAHTWMPGFKVHDADALAAYARGLKNTPYQMSADGRITAIAVQRGVQPPAATYYPHFLAKQVRIELGYQRLLALRLERQLAS